MLPREALVHFAARPGWLWSFHALSGELAFQAILVCLAAGCAVLLGVGYRTRLAAVVSWLLLASLQHRNPLILIAGDRILLLLLFWGLFLPLGARWSLDARAGRIRATGSRTTGFPACALLLQTALVYAATSLYKWTEPSWRGLDAVALTLSVDGVATPLGRSLLEVGALPALLTALTLTLETLAPWLAFWPRRNPRVRVCLVFALVGFHLGLAATLRLGLMQLVMCVAWIPFLPAAFWDSLGSRPGPATGPQRSLSASRLETALALACFGLVLIDSAIAIDRERYERGAPRWSSWLIHSLGLRQEWRMWQRPLHNRYYVFAARLRDGRQVDLHTGRALDWDAPRPRSENNHWWKYQDALSRPAGAPLRGDYARFLAERWQRQHPDAAVVARLALVHVDASEPASRKGLLPRRMLWEGAPLADGNGARSAPQ